ncbi:hypothetical protein BDZ89DRAFT_1078775, partial [Hymenopellis radicata]
MIFTLSTLIRRTRLWIYRLLSVESQWAPHRVRIFRFGLPFVYDSFIIESYTYTLMSKLPGDMLIKLAAENNPVTEAFFKGICSEIEAVMRRIWSLPQPAHLKGQVMISASGDGLTLTDIDQHVLRKMVQTMSPKYGDVKAILEADQLVFTHPDLTLPNILVTKDGRLSGIIDWEDAGWCPMEYQWRWMRANL